MTPIRTAVQCSRRGGQWPVAPSLRKPIKAAAPFWGLVLRCAALRCAAWLRTATRRYESRSRSSGSRSLLALSLRKHELPSILQMPQVWPFYLYNYTPIPLSTFLSSHHLTSQSGSLISANNLYFPHSRHRDSPPGFQLYKSHFQNGSHQDSYHDWRRNLRC
jgi:hypothetical protein